MNTTFKIGGETEINRLGYGAMRITGRGVWGEPENGRHIVRQHCAGCHNVQPSGVSVYREAPPFRTLGARYDGFSLRENVARISGAPHYGMPQIILSPQDAWDIAAYINAFAAADPRRRRKMAVAPCINGPLPSIGCPSALMTRPSQRSSG